MKRARFTRADWAALALRVLAEGGPSAVTVKGLCEAAGRTTGSLYHHFPGHEALLEGMLTHWVAQYTDAVISAVNLSPKNDGKRPEHLNMLANALDFGVEVGVRRLVAQRETLRPIVADVDRRRVAFIRELFIQDGVSHADATVLAEVEYAAFVGFQHTAEGRSPEALQTLYLDFRKMMFRGVNRSSAGGQ